MAITEGNYTASQLTTELATQLDIYFDTADRPDTYTVRYNATTNKTRLFTTYTSVIFLTLTDGEVATFANSFIKTVDINNLNSINRVTGNLIPAPDACTSVVPYITDFTELVPFKNLYLDYNEISNYNQLTVAGISSIIRKINETVPYLGVLNNNELSSVGYMDESGKMQYRLNFRLTNNLKQVVNLNNTGLPFTVTLFRGD